MSPVKSVTHVFGCTGLGFVGAGTEGGSVDCLTSFFDEPWSDEMIQEVESIRSRMGWSTLHELEVVHARKAEYSVSIPSYRHTAGLMCDEP